MCIKYCYGNLFVLFFKQNAAYGLSAYLMGVEMGIGDRRKPEYLQWLAALAQTRDDKSALDIHLERGARWIWRRSPGRASSAAKDCVFLRGILYTYDAADE